MRSRMVGVLLGILALGQIARAEESERKVFAHYMVCIPTYGGNATVADYQRTGGLASAIEALSDGVFHTLSEPQQLDARRLFLELVEVSGEGVARRRLPLDAVGAATLPVVTAFVDARILTASDTDRMIELYQRTGTHLSVLRSVTPDPTLVTALSALLGRARRRMGARRTSTFRGVVGFFTDSFPAALYRLRWWWIVTGLACVAVAVAFGWYLVLHPELESRIGTPEELRQLVEVDFEHYYSTYAASSFALRVWTNNAWVSAQVIAMGVLGVPVVLILLNNMLNLGLVGGILTNHGAAHVFWGLILPHGLLELTAVFDDRGSLEVLCGEAGSDRLLFGTDSPWADQAEELARWRALGLPEDRGLTVNGVAP